MTKSSALPATIRQQPLQKNFLTTTMKQIIPKAIAKPATTMKVSNQNRRPARHAMAKRPTTPCRVSRMPRILDVPIVTAISIRTEPRDAKAATLVKNLLNKKMPHSHVRTAIPSRWTHSFQQQPMHSTLNACVVTKNRAKDLSATMPAINVI